MPKGIGETSLREVGNGGISMAPVTQPNLCMRILKEIERGLEELQASFQSYQERKHRPALYKREIEDFNYIKTKIGQIHTHLLELGSGYHHDKVYRILLGIKRKLEEVRGISPVYIDFTTEFRHIKRKIGQIYIYQPELAKCFGFAVDVGLKTLEKSKEQHSKNLKKITCGAKI